MYKLLAIVACLMWGAALPLIKLALELGAPLPLAALRFILAGILLLLPAILLSCRIPFRAEKKTLAAIGRSALGRSAFLVLQIALFQTFIIYGLYFPAMRLVAASSASIIIGSGPLIAALMGHFLLQQKLQIRRFAALFVGIFGIALLSWHKAGLQNPGETNLQWGNNYLLGLAMLLCGAISAAFGNILIVRHGQPERSNGKGKSHSFQKPIIHPVLLASLQMIIGGLGLLLLSFSLDYTQSQTRTQHLFANIAQYFQPDSPHGSWRPLIALASLTLISATAFSLWFFLLSQKGAQVAAINLWKFLIPFSGTLLSWLWLQDDAPDPYTLGGMLLVSCSILLFYLPFPSKRFISNAATPQKPRRDL